MNTLHRLSSLFIAFLFTFISAMSVAGQKPVVLDPSYNHDRFDTQPKDIVREFRAFTTSFDSLDDNDGNGEAEAWGVPEWASYEIKRFSGECIPTKKRPPWFAERALIRQGIAPKGDSYVYSNPWRPQHPDWYVRGHLAMKLIAERLGHDAAHNTHTFLNAVPQRSNFNKGIWLNLEYLTAAWAQRFGSVWVITGPVIIDDAPSGWIGEAEKNEMRVAIPDALFKIVVKDAKDSSTPDVLAFLYPQVGSGYANGAYDHKKYLTSVNEIEELTGLDFLTSLSDNIENHVERDVAGVLWESSDSDFVSACR